MELRNLKNKKRINRKPDKISIIEKSVNVW